MFLLGWKPGADFGGRALGKRRCITVERWAMAHNIGRRIPLNDEPACIAVERWVMAPNIGRRIPLNGLTWGLAQEVLDHWLDE